MDLKIPKNYVNHLDLKETEEAIKLVKDCFEVELANQLNLQRVSAPLFVAAGTGINDDLNGIERPVSFDLKNISNVEAEIVQSLAKWKRLALARYGFTEGSGLYTDMNAIRRDEVLDNLHSVYVDQWDWERVISKEERNLDFLKNIVRKIYEVLKETELVVYKKFPQLQPFLRDEISFIHSEELQERYPELNPRDREDAITKEKGAVFVIGIGGELADGKPHDGRAPDYDDWTTPTGENTKGLNGDIFVWNPVLEIGFEISSMGIRVDKESLLRQLEITDTLDRKELMWHKMLLEGRLPLSIGGGIGQSRLCMLFLQKAHIGEVQCGVWPDEMVRACEKNNIFLL
ncbi:aspartate--ammonia ligase [candidate division WOR-3 bacterium]|nr:aspartate--ammonia ligase [candidate division WOR-3 bacterium]